MSEKNETSTMKNSSSDPDTTPPRNLRPGKRKWRRLRVAVGTAVVLSTLLIASYFIIPALVLRALNVRLIPFGWRAVASSSALTFIPFTARFGDVEIVSTHGDSIAKAPQIGIRVMRRRVVVEEPSITLESPRFPNHLELSGHPTDFVNDDWSVEIEDGTVSFRRKSEFELRHVRALITSDREKGRITFRVEGSLGGSFLVAGKIESNPDQLDPLSASAKVRLTSVPLRRLEPLITAGGRIKQIEGMLDLEGEYTIGSQTPFEGRATFELRDCTIETATGQHQKIEFSLFRGTHHIRMRGGIRFGEIGLHELRGARLTPGIDLSSLLRSVLDWIVRDSPNSKTASASSQTSGSPSETCVAIMKGDLKRLQELSSDGVNLNEKDAVGFTLLTCAVAGDCRECVQWLLAQGAEIELAADIGELRGVTPLGLACNLGKRSIAKLLIQHGADINRGGYLGRTPLYQASAAGVEELVRYLVDRGAAIDATDDEGRTPLMVACFSGQKAVVSYLLNSGANPTHRDHQRMSALIAAAQEGHLKIVELLLAHDAEPGHVSENGMTALAAACRDGREDVAMLLIKSGSDVNAENQDGYTPLIFSSYRGMLLVVRALLDHGADPNASDRLGRPCLLAAVGRRHHQTASALLESGADPDKGIEGVSPLGVAILVQDHRMVDLLLAAGANIRSENEKVMGPLDLAKALVESNPTNKTLSRILHSIEDYDGGGGN